MRIQIQTHAGFRLLYFELGVWGVDPKAVAARINEISELLAGPETVLLRGQGPVWVYAMLTHAAHAAPNVATFEPRKNGFVVATRHNGPYEEGAVIPADEVGMTVDGGRIVGGTSLTADEHLVIAVGGPPHSGKSVFLAELYRQLLARKPGEVFLQRACPDGEGMWSAESDPLLAQIIRQKGAFTENFCSWVVKTIRGLKRGFRITLLDLGGKRMSPNDEILQNSTHLVVLSSDADETQKWAEYGAEHGCEVLAVLDSQMRRLADGTLDNTATSSLDLSVTPVRGELANLDRKGPVSPYQSTISQFADWLIQKARL